MLANNVTATNGGKTDVTGFAGAGQTVPAAVAVIGQGDAAPFGGGLPQHQCCARGGINLHAVMRLDDFDIPIGVQSGGDFLGEAGQQIDPKAHIAGADDHRMAGGGLQFLQVRCLQPGGADDMHGAGLRRQRGEFHRGGGDGEVDHRLSAGKGVERVVGDSDPQVCSTHRRPQIAADPGVTAAFDRTHQPRLVRRRDHSHQHLTHPAGRAGNDDTRQVVPFGHGAFLFPDRLPLAVERPLGKAPLRAGGTWPK